MTMKRGRARPSAWLVLGLASSSLVALSARADIAVSSNDAHTNLTKEGKQVAPKDAPNDTVSVIDLGQFPPKITATIDAPGSVVGPPMAVAVTPDEHYAIVSSATRADPAAASGIAPDDRVSVIDLRSTPPKIVQQTTTGAGAAVVRITADGGTVMIVNRTEGSLSVLSLRDGQLGGPASKLDLSAPKSLPSGLALTPDGKTALLTRFGDNLVNVLHLDGTRITLDPRPITAGVAPYTIDINRQGTLAAVGNMGRVDGDADSVSLIDLTRQPYRVVETVTVPSTPEGVKFSPDGKYLAVGSQNGSGKAADSPFFTDHSLLTVFAVAAPSAKAGPMASRLRAVAQAPAGRWCQGIAFSRDGRTILLQAMGDHSISVFRFEKDKLTAGAPLPTKGGPAAIQTAWH